jgi:Fur family transcriptional regulator, ferric uptake regulator
MTRKSDTAVQQLKTRIRGAGLRFTGARASVLRTLEKATTPMSHADVVAKVASEGFEPSTIYRNLIDLETAGLVHRLDVGDHVWRFELRGESDNEHAHFVCGSCGAVECLPEASVTIKGVAARVGHVAEVLLKGSCASCR